MRKLILISMCILMYSCAASLPGPTQRALEYNKTNNYLGWKSLVIDEETLVKSKSVDYQCDYNFATVYSLLQLYKSPTNLYVIENADGKAEMAYNYVKNNCAGLEHFYQNIDSVMSSYHTVTGQPGKGIIYAEKGIQIAKGLEAKANNEGVLSAIYYNMGIRNLRDHHLKLATQYYKEHLATQKPESQSDLIFYKSTFLESRLSDLSTVKTPEALKEMHKLWLEIEAITRKAVSNDTQFVTYTQGAEFFASAGDHDFADKLLNEAKKLAAAYPYKNSGAQKLDIMSSEARIKYEKGAFSEAAELFEKWANAFEMIGDEKLGATSLTYAGIAMEKAGNYDKSLMLLEKALSLREEQRSSFAVKQRGSFLSISNARPYWSLARSYAQLYQKTKDKRFLAKSLGIDSKMRARQFGELVGLKQSDDYLQDKPPLVNGELLLNYLVTDSDIILTALSNTWAEQFIIKKSRDEIEATVNDVREAIAQQSMKKYEDAVANLSAVLITPIKGKLSQFPKLVVSLDGHLNLVPFSIVLSESNKPMITSHAVTHVPSIDYFRWMRNTKGDVPQTGNKVFVLANPQYAAKLTISKLDSYEQSIMTRSIDQYNLFAPLPETLKEAQNIELRFGGSNTFSISGSEATKKKILSSDLSQYRYLHFATHGILGDQISGINEPALVMAAADTFDGNFLRLSDLEKIKLNAELTVLSACDTGRGEYVNGEGVFGMSRGFLQAGSKSVLVSLWPVASDATVVFMDRFYGYLRSGKSKAESLRMTQMDFLKGIPISDVDRRSVKIIDKKTKRFSAGDSKNPFYWAPFVIIGE